MYMICILNICRYCDTINNIIHVVQQRQMFPWLQNEIIFYTSPLKKVYDNALNTLHKFTKDVIREKRTLHNEAKICLTGPTIRHIRHCIQMF